MISAKTEQQGFRGLMGTMPDGFESPDIHQSAVQYFPVGKNDFCHSECIFSSGHFNNTISIIYSSCLFFLPVLNRKGIEILVIRLYTLSVYIFSIRNDQDCVCVR